ncbi:hypothetical protein [Deinococcus hohokamensis]|uniref:Uncharacterized protein n=1 Tax=Deinococcus hohokamensis TaxID=309883 RepID=A0ABV9IDV9_9DEIO
MMEGMSCVLRASGTTFDVDRYLTQTELSPVVIRVFRQGERDWPGQKLPHDSSGLNLRASEAEFSALSTQIDDTLTFLDTYAADLRLLTSFPGVEDIVLDFGIEDRDVAAQADYFPPGLLQRMGALNIGLVVSRYPPDVPESSIEMVNSVP